MPFLPLAEAAPLWLPWLCSETAALFSYITVQLRAHNPKKALTELVAVDARAKYLDDQLDEDSVNKAAFAKIRTVR
jgi:hypothetical protein